MIRTKTFATLAVAGAVTLSPLLALADDNASTSVTVDAEASTTVKHHSLLDAIKAHYESYASTSDERKGDEASTTDRKAGAEERKTANQQKHITNEQDRGENQVDARISVLQKLEARINAMKRLTSDEKSALDVALTAEINALTSLKTQIASSTSTTTLVAELKTVGPDYRTYLLVMPRTAIIAAANRVMDITTQMGTVGTKLEARITAAKSAGADVSSADTAYADFTAKVADAKVQAQAALDLVVNLKADQGNSATFAANTAALKSARGKLQAAHADLVDARKDMETIMHAVKGKGEAHATTTASTNE